MRDLKIFKNEEFGEIRTVTIDNEPWFVAADISKPLGYRMASDMTRRIEYEDKATHSVSTLGGIQKMIVVNESGLYSAILGSKLESARRFKRWVTSDVLPSIRKTGSYTANALNGKELLALAVLEAQKTIEQQNEQIERMKPKEIFADAVSTSHTSILVGDLAKLICQNGYSIGQKRMFIWLRDNGFLMKLGNSKNLPKQKYIEQGLFEIKESNIQNPDGSVRITKTTKVTGKGQVYFINKFLNELD